MTTETSNARGEVVAWRLWRTHTVSGDWMPCTEEWNNGKPEPGIAESMNNSASRYRVEVAYAAPPPAAARGDVRGLVDRVTDYLCEQEYDIGGRDELRKHVAAALAAEGVQAGAVEERARAMFEAQADRLAAPWDRQWEPTKEHWRAEARAALSQQPEARGVVARTLDDWHEDDGVAVWWKFPVDEPAWIGTPNDTDWPGYHTHWTPHPEVPAALTGERNG